MTPEFAKQVVDLEQENAALRRACELAWNLVAWELRKADDQPVAWAFAWADKREELRAALAAVGMPVK